MNYHLPFDNLLELRGSLIPSNALNPNRLPVGGRNRFSLQLDGAAPFGLRAALSVDDQLPAAAPLSWTLIRPSGLALSSTLLASNPAFDYGVTFNPEILYRPNDTLQMEAAAGQVSDGGFTFVFRGVKYLTPEAPARPEADEMAFTYFDEFQMVNGGVGGAPFQTLRRSIQLEPDADFALQTLAFRIEGNYNEVRLMIWDANFVALSNRHIPIEIAGGNWGIAAEGPRVFAPDVLYPANGTLTFELTSWSPNELNTDLEVLLAFGGVKRYRR
jgi:hypothetical protein